MQRLGLGRVQVAGRDQPRPAIAQGQEQRHRLGFQVDTGPDATQSMRVDAMGINRPFSSSRG
jgi:hypothetical protein